MPEDTSSSASSAAKIPVWVGVASTIFSVALTAYNVHATTSIGVAESVLHTRAEEVEESKEKVARYAWIRTLLPDLEDQDPQKRAFTLALMRLALEKDEAEQLFASLTGSANKDLQQVGQTGLANIQNEGISQLVAQLNADTPDARKKATASLIAGYKSSSFAISFALQLVTGPSATSLSPSATIDVFYYLGATDPTVWTDTQIALGRQAVTTAQARNTGPQMQQAIDTFKSLLQKTTESKP